MQSAADDTSASWGPVSFDLGPLVERFGFRGVPTLLEPAKETADSPVKLLFKDERGRPGAVLSLSSPAAPGLVADDADRAARAKRMLGQRLGCVILDPIARGDVEGVSYVLWPWRRPLAVRRPVWLGQRTILRSHLFSWLRQATRKTMRETSPVHFLEALDHANGHAHLGFDLRRSAALGAERIRAGTWLPKHVLAHNDLWQGNVLLDAQMHWLYAVRAGRFAIIDWAGAETSGYPLYDVVRLAQSFGLCGRALADELRLHCRILGGTLDDAKPYLAAALGHLGENLGHVPQARFVSFANVCWSALSSAVTA
jgi:hypothetical protein